VIDDGSDDNTAHIARSFGGSVRCVIQENSGVSGARNHGVEASRGEFLAFLDSDDLWLPRKLEWQLRHFELHPETEMVFGQMQAFISPEVEASYGRSIDTSTIPGLCASTLLLRKETFQSIGLFDVDQKVSEFIEWFSRAQDKGCYSHVVPELVMKRRAHMTNTVLDRARMNSQYARVIKTVLDRRRAASPR
jgi:glycosyltransferase involved in cell wall biosynthesis